MTEAPTRPGALPALIIACLGGLALLVPILFYGPGSVESVDGMWRKWGETGLGDLWTSGISGTYAPVAGVSAWVDHQWGAGVGDVRMAHVQSAVLHLLTSVVFLGFLRGLGVGVLAAGLAAGAFLLHPAAFETATLIGFRPALWAALFGLVACVAVQGRGPWVFIAVFSMALAVLADFTAVIFPVLAAVYAWARRRQSLVGDAGTRGRGALAAALLLGLPALATGGLVLWMQGAVPTPQWGLAADPLLAVLWPRLPGFVYAGAQAGALGSAVLLVSGALALVASRWQPTLGPGLGMVALGSAAAVVWTPGGADLPRVLVLAGLLATLVSLPRPGPGLLAATAAALALIGGVVAVRRVPLLQDGPELWREAAKSRPLAALRLADQLAASSLIDARREALGLLEGALSTVASKSLRLEIIELASAVHSKLGEAEAASRRAEEACALAESLRAAEPGLVDEQRMLQIYLRAVECFHIEDSRQQIDLYFDRARALAPQHPEVLAGDAERLYVALVHALRRESQNPQLDLKPGWLPPTEPRLAAIEAKLAAALARDPRCYRALVLKGRMAEAQGGLLTAVPLYQQAAAARPDRVEARVLLATLYVTNDLPEAAEECVRGALQEGLDDPALHYLLGNIYAVQGRRDDARRYLEAYVLNRPDNRDAKALLANLLSAEALSKVDQLEIADLVKLAERIRELNPDDPKGWMVQAAVHCKSRPRRFVEAIVLLEKAKEKMPESIDLRRQLASAHRDYGWALVLQKRRDRAMDHFVKFLALATPDQRKEAVRNAVVAHGKTLEQEGRDHMREQKPDAAEAVFRRATELTPTRPESFYQLGVACFRQQKLVPARAAFERALTLSQAARDGGATVYALPLVDLLVRSGDRAGAQKVADRVLAAPGDADEATLARLRAMLK